jgi:hypothetical protein
MATIKALASGQPVDTREVYARHKKLMGYHCKHLFLSNHLPNTKDGERGVTRRLLLTSFSQDFSANKDSQLKEKIAAERDGLFNKILGALPDLFAMHEIPLGGRESKTTTVRVNVMIDPFGEFIRQCLVYEPGEMRDGECWNGLAEPKENVTKVYQLFIDDYSLGNELPHSHNLMRKLRDKLPDIKEFWPGFRKDPLRRRFLFGLSITPEWRKRLLHEEAKAQRPSSDRKPFSGKGRIINFDRVLGSKRN